MRALSFVPASSLTTRGPRPWAIALLAGLAVSNLLTLLALSANPQIVSAFSGGSVPTLEAYQTRLDYLRLEVERLQSREIGHAGDISLQLADLAEQQATLGEQRDDVLLLAAAASKLGLVPPEPSAYLAQWTIDAPAASSAEGELKELQASVRRMSDETRLAMVSLYAAASVSADRITLALRQIGIAPETPTPGGSGTGGPFIPASGSDTAGQSVSPNAILGALARLQAARTAMMSAPIRRPLRIELNASSPYGTRKDPFTGQSAFHSGIDFPAPEGTPVLSAGRGVVTFVGWRSGYGNIVEIDHGSGLTSRYPHLSAALVEQGDIVEPQTEIALVGSTGRSTGAHLHFEVRRNDEALNPKPFLRAGGILEEYL